MAIIFIFSTLCLFFVTPLAHAASTNQTSEIIVRSLAPEDWKAFRDLRLKALKENPLAYGIAVTDESVRPDEEWQAICQDAYHGNGKWYLIAEYKNRLVGVLGAHEQGGTYMRHLVEIVGAYVDPDFRRCGVMKQLFCALKNRLLETPHVEQLIAWVTLHEQQTGKYLFESFGFTYAGKLSRITKYDGRYYDCCWLEAPLTRDPD